jgi:hypothetical protein
MSEDNNIHPHCHAISWTSSYKTRLRIQLHTRTVMTKQYCSLLTACKPQLEQRIWLALVSFFVLHTEGWRRSKKGLSTISYVHWLTQVKRAQYSLRLFLYISLNYSQQDAKFSWSIYFYKLLYMFQAVPSPIIKSTKLYIQRQVLSNQYGCLQLSVW